MKKSLGCCTLVASLLPGLAIGKQKETKIDPRMKEIHTVFLKGAFTAIQEVQDKRAEIEKDSCLKLVETADTADAIAKVSYTPGGAEQIDAGPSQPPGVGLQEIRPYHTALELSVRQGTKTRKI